MAKFGKQELWQAGSCLVCIVVAWIHLDDLGNSEFAGGWLTGGGAQFLIPQHQGRSNARK